MTKARTLDIGKVNEALKRAAAAAKTGSRDERAGRIIARDSTSGVFMPKTTRGANSKSVSTKK